MARTGSIPFIAKETWTHDFCLLSSTTAQKTPTSVEADKLRKAGLGKRKIVFPSKDADHNQFVKQLEASYPKLKLGGGFELLKGVGGGSGARSLENLPLGPNGYSIRYIRETICIGQAVLYIRPLQAKLDMTPEQVDYVCTNNFEYYVGVLFLSFTVQLRYMHAVIYFVLVVLCILCAFTCFVYCSFVILL